MNTPAIRRVALLCASLLLLWGLLSALLGVGAAPDAATEPDSSVRPTDPVEHEAVKDGKGDDAVDGAGVVRPVATHTDPELPGDGAPLSSAAPVTSPPPGDPPAAQEIALRVLDHHGLPVGGVACSFSTWTGGEGLYVGGLGSEKRTDAQGQVSWRVYANPHPLNHNVIQLSHPEYLPLQISDVAPTERTVRLEPVPDLVTFDIELVDDRGEPVPHVRIVVTETTEFDGEWSGHSGARHELQLDRHGKGSIEVPALAPSHDPTRFRRARLFFTHRYGNVTRAERRVSPPFGPRTAIRMTLPRMSQLVGTVRPIPEEPVTLHTLSQDDVDQRPVKLDAAGRFKLELRPGETIASVSIADAGSQAERFSAAPGDAVHVHFNLGGAEPVLQGSVVNAAGRPLAGANVRGLFVPLVWNGFGRMSSHTVVTDERGHFAFYAPRAPGELDATLHEFVELTEVQVSGRTHIRLELVRSLSASIRIVDPFGDPVAGAIVGIVGPHLVGDRGGNGADDGRWETSLMSDRQGCLELRELAPATWEIHGPRVKRQVFRVEPGVPSEVTIEGLAPAPDAR